jgi:hypothetical protein
MIFTIVFKIPIREEMRSSSLDLDHGHMDNKSWQSCVSLEMTGLMEDWLEAESRG